MRSHWDRLVSRYGKRKVQQAAIIILLVAVVVCGPLSVVTLLPRLAGAQTTFTPNTYSSFTSTGNALASASDPFTPIPPTGPAQGGGTSPVSAPPASGTPLTNPVRLALDAQHLYDGTSTVGDPTAATLITSSEGILSLQVADHAVDITKASVPGAGLLGSSVSAGSDGPLTLELKPTTGTFRGASMTLAGFALHVVDAQSREAQGVSLHAPLLLTFHYHPRELAGLNTQDLRLVWPATADRPHNQPPAEVPVTVNAQNGTLTASVSTLQSGPMLLAGAQSDANPASSEHLQMTGNNGDVTFTVPFDVPPAAGALAPNLQLVYSSGGPNGRFARNAPAPWTGDGWDLSLGSITYDSGNGLYYLNGVGGDSEVLLCCHNTNTSNVNYFVPHHHADIRVFTSDNSQNPFQTGASFVVRTPDGLEYDLGASSNAKHTTVVSGALQTIEWDVSKVARLYDTGSGSGALQQYTVTYWQDTASSGGLSYTRDAAPEEIDYNFIGSSALARIYFNVHWPGASVSGTPTAPASATSYGANFNCSTSRSPLQATTLRCDDPVQPSGYEAPPLTMSTLTLDSVVMQVQSGGAWHTVRSYSLGYAPDLPGVECWDDTTGQVYACDGEHLLSSVQETPYQNDSPMPSLRPITFAYSSATLNEYHDTTEKGFDNNIYDAQTWWQYLTGFSDGQTGAGATVAYKRAYGNSWGVPSGNDVDPFNCDTNSCLVPEDRQWPRQAVYQITDTGTGATTTYSYGLNLACGTNCTEDTWIPPNGWNTCGDAGLPPTTRPMPACLESGWQNYYNEEYTGFLQVYATQPDGSTDYTQYYAGNGWGTNDWDTANLARNMPIGEEIFQGAAGGILLHEVDHAYTALNCPSGISNNGQLYNNPYMFCLNYETQIDTYQGGGSGGATVPHETVSRSYDPYFWYTMLDSSAASLDDGLADSSTNYGSTQPTFTTNYSYTGRDGAQEPSPTPYYFEELAQSQTQTDNLGNRWTCSTTQYDGLSFLPNYLQSSIKYALPTQTNAFSDCGNSGNGYTTSGQVTTGTGYDAYGRKIVSTDADALAGVSGHTGCTPGAGVLVAYPTSAPNGYTTCTTYDSTQHAYATASGNALGQQSSTSWDVVQGVSTSSTDPNNATTGYAGPIYEYSGAPSLATYQDTYTQTTLPGETYGSPAWTSRVFSFSFCAGATGSQPCVETDTVKQLDGTNLAVSRAFYDRDGRLVETRSSGPTDLQDTVTYSVYDATHAKVFASQACSVPSFSTSSGGRTVSSTPNYIAPTQTSSGSSAYFDPGGSNGTCTPTLTGTTTYSDAMGRALATDDAMGTGAGTSGSGCVLPGSTTHHTSCTTYTSVFASATSGLPSSDTEPYLQTLTIDANLHQIASYTDALGRTAYAQRFSGASQNPLGSGISSYSVTSNKYDGAGNLVTTVDPQGHATTFGFNKLAQQTSLGDPDRGSESYSYDANGNVTQTVDARGASGTFYAAYDGLNRQLWRNSSNSGSGAYVSYSYDSSAGGNDGVGRLTGESFNGGNGGTALGHGSYSYIYDARGQKTSWGATLGGNSYTFSYSYTDYGASNTLTYSDGEQALYTYGNSGALVRVRASFLGAASATLFPVLSYSTAAGTSGLLSSATVAQPLAAYAYTYTPTYDGDLRAAGFTWTQTSSGATLFTSARTYDNVGNVSSVSTILPAGTDNQAFCYDEQNRLTWASSTSGAPPCGVSLTSGTLTSAAYGPVSFAYD
ncbi:MAG TPA: hypothetical protein VF120_07630, partial [Ktedonobacterales bacterium]